jgi:hypothetical protein
VAPKAEAPAKTILIIGLSDWGNKVLTPFDTAPPTTPPPMIATSLFILLLLI